MSAVHLAVGRGRVAQLFRTLLVSAIALQLSGCAKDHNLATDIGRLMTSSDGLTFPEQRALERSKRFAEIRVKSAVIGGTLGAVMAGAACALAVEDSNAATTAACAAGGAVAGAVGAYLIGAYYANLEEEAEGRRNDLNVQLAAAKRAVGESEAQVSNVREIVRAERSKIRELNAQYGAGRITQDQYKSQITKLELKANLVQEQLNLSKADVNTMDAVIKDQKARGNNVSKLSAERKTMVAVVDKLTKERDSLLEAIASIPAEMEPPVLGAVS